jgi:hypothetical protein
VEKELLVAKREAKKRFKNSEFDMCRNLWILLHALIYLTPQYTKDMIPLIELVDEEYRYCLYH